MERLFRALRDAFHSPESPLYTPLSRLIWALILLSIALFSADLYLGPEAPGGALLTWLDSLLLGAFAVEIGLRVLTYTPPELGLFVLSPRQRLRAHLLGRLRFCLRPLNLIDIVVVLAVVPALRGLRALRALRLLRGSRFFRYSSPLRGILRAFEDNAILYAAAFAVLGVAILLGGTSIYLIDGRTNEDIRSLSDGIWWAIVTITTVGYGDITPSASALGRTVAGALMIVGMFTLALFAGIVGHTLLNAVLSIREEQFRMSSLTHHLIICGYEDAARMFLDTLAQEVDPERVDVVIFAPGERPAGLPPQLTWVSGDPTKESELAKVRLTHADTVVILGSRSVSPQHADATTILTAFTMRAYMRRSPAAGRRRRPLYIVGEILDEENVEHAATAGVDEVIESTRVGFSLLAHAAAVPGTARIMGQLAVMEAQNLYVGRIPAGLDTPRAFEALAREVKRSTGALLIGLREGAERRELINPPDDHPVSADCQLIYLAERAVLPEL